jgi:hypothetical protein
LKIIEPGKGGLAPGLQPAGHPGTQPLEPCHVDKPPEISRSASRESNSRHGHFWALMEPRSRGWLGGWTHDVVQRLRPRWIPAGKRLVDRTGESLAFDCLVSLVPFGEVGQDLLREQLDRLADVLVLVAPGLTDEHHLVDAGRLVALEQLAHLSRAADRAAQ